MSASTHVSSTADLQTGITDIDRMTDLSRSLRTRLHDEFALTTPLVVNDEQSVDGTRNSCWSSPTHAGSNRCSSRIRPMTFCISTQVGCAMACGFCLTGKMGLSRHLTAGEMRASARPRRGHGLSRHPLQHRAHGDGERSTTMTAP